MVNDNCSFHHSFANLIQITVSEGQKILQYKEEVPVRDKICRLNCVNYVSSTVYLHFVLLGSVIFDALDGATVGCTDLPVKINAAPR